MDESIKNHPFGWFCNSLAAMTKILNPEWLEQLAERLEMEYEDWDIDAQDTSCGKSPNQDVS